MKTLIVILATALMSQAALAGDNGHYLKCVSGSGKTELLMGHIGEYDNDAMKLSIMGRSLGEMKSGTDVQKIELNENTTRYVAEMDGELTDLLTVQTFEQTAREARKQTMRAKILSGFNPNKMTALDHTIELTCEIVYNEI